MIKQMIKIIKIKKKYIIKFKKKLIVIKIF